MTATAFRPAAAHGLNKVARCARTEPGLRRVRHAANRLHRRGRPAP